MHFRFDGREYQGYRGDTLASALLANGVHGVTTSIKYGRPRGIMAAGPEEPNALVQVEKPFPEPMLTATTLALRDGMEAAGLPGRGSLATEPDPARYDAMHAHCDVLVVGAGPAGLAAAVTAARSGARVILADADTESGGSLLGTGELLDGAPATVWVQRAVRELAAHPEVRLLERTTVFGHYEDNYAVAVQHRGDDAPSRQRIWRIRAREIVLATGAHERPLVFPGNDRPGTMLAGSARTYLHRYGVLPGSRAVVFTTNDSAYAAAIDLHDAGVDIAAIVDARDVVSTYWASLCVQRGITIRHSATVAGTSGTERVTGAYLANLSHGATHAMNVRRVVRCDLLLVSGGWNPAVQLHGQSGGAVRFDEDTASFLPEPDDRRVRSAGAAAGAFTTAACLRTGADAGAEAARACGFAAEPGTLPDAKHPPVLAGYRGPWFLPSPIDNEGGTQFVDLARDATVADIRRAVGAGMDNVEHVKRYTTIGTAHDQGKTSGTTSTGIIAELLGRDVADIGTTTSRAPYTPVTFAALAGRDRGDLYDPIRVTALHDWHVEHGAPFENVGQWKRPWYYPRRGEDMEAAVLRECRAVRTGVGMQDVSTLGKIDVQGPDAAEFLDLVYTNKMSTLRVGRIRYGVMCTADGMVFDDGTLMRTAEHRYLLTTTSGNAAAVLEWLEDWLQTEWTHLRVHLTSVTEHWATIALAGPHSRDVLARVTDIDVDNDAFGFMDWRDGTVAGRSARVCRISFSGELAFEINIPWWYGREVWEALHDAGKRFGITPYGTETMHVLRAEKGLPIVGQDTDGTVTPYDLGMSWAVSKKKDDFLGKRSFSRVDTARSDRKHLVGLLPRDTGVVVPEGSQLVATTELPAPPVPMLGHVTSSYRSSVLGQGFSLALVKAGRERIGETIYSPVGGRLIPLEVTEPVFYDKEGARRDG
nr:2Fe-2S iron-sulfur cluster-binding protein [Saccharopolyspora sp. HNM0983]